MTFVRAAKPRVEQVWPKPCKGRRLQLFGPVDRETHAAAGRIYKRNGLTRTRSKSVHSFGVDLREETLQIRF